ncbi:MAG: ABC transporter ATP-binding protein [bacterium]
MNIIETKEISRVFEDQGKQVVALNKVSFKLPQGESLSVIGPSGSGKSTLLHILGGLDTPSSGKILINGKNPKELNDTELSGFRNSTIGFVFQFFYLQDFLSAEENIALPLLIKGVSTKEAKERAKELVIQVGLAERRDHTPNKLSGGEQQRVAIARALVNDPKVILADEPTGNLDQENAGRIFSLLKEISETGVSVVVITHDRNVTKYFPKTFELTKGRAN